MKVNKYLYRTSYFNSSFFRLGLIFAERLRSLNQTFYHHHFPNTFHGSHLLLYGPLKFDIAYEMVEHIARKIRENL